MIYIFILLFALFLTLNNDLKVKKENSGFGFSLLFLLMVFVAGFRYLNGGDTFNYYMFFLDSDCIESLTKTSLEDSRYQPGFLVFVAICKSISDNFLVMQLIESLFLNYILFRFIKNECNVPHLAVMLYFILNYLEFNMEIMRECMAIGFGILYYNSLYEKKYIYSIVWIMLAYSMHVSALILLFYPLADSVKYNKGSFFVVSIILAVIPFLYLLVPNIETYANLIFRQEEWVTNGYTQQEFNSTLNTSFYIQHVVLRFLLPMCSIYYLSKNGDDKYIGYIYLFVVLHMLGMISYAFYRFANYFAPFWWIILAKVIHMVIERNKIKNKGLILSGVLLILLVFYQHSQLLYDSKKQRYLYERYIPYNNVITDNTTYK